MKYTLTLFLDSRYSETDPQDINYLVGKLEEMAQLLKTDINAGKYVGLHFTCVDYDAKKEE